MSFLRFIGAASALILAITPAVAADFDQPLEGDQPLQEYVPTRPDNGWYVRGDIGHVFSVRAAGGFTNSVYDPATAAYLPQSYDTVSLGGSFTGGVGFGYHFSDYFRTDATFDVLRTSFDGAASSALPCSGDPGLGGTTCRMENSTQATAYSFMANAYVDLGTFARFTPYIGAGLGAAYVDWGRLDSQALCQGSTCPASFQAVAHPGGDGSWRFAWAVMAGVSYDITPRLKADLGYRFRDIGGGRMYGFDSASAVAGSMQGSDHGLRSHEVRIGLRYALR